MKLEEARRVLGVGEGCTDEELRTAYLAACKAAHPDAGGSATAFRDVKAAFDLLKSLAAPEPAIPRFRRTCPTCAGEGHLILQSGRPGRGGLRKRCPACNGDGLL